MASSTMVPMFAPDGTLGEIPQERLQDALKAGAKPAVQMKAPDGTVGYIPAARYADALKNGATIVPPSQQDTQHEGFWDAAWNDVKGAAQGLYQAAKNPLETAQHGAIGVMLEDEKLKQQGASKGYRALAGTAQMVGANVPGMEQAAAQGDPNAVLGHAVAAAAPYVAGMAADAAKPAAEGVQKWAGNAASDLYRSALKPTTVPAKQAVVSAAIQTGLENRIPVSEAGVEKLAGLIDQTNQAISDAIASKPGSTVNKYAVASRLTDTAQKFANQAAPTADLNTIANVGNDFLDTKPSNIPASQAQDIKIGTYQQVKKNYGQLSSASVEAQKALARGLKEELANAFPELNQLNAKDSQFYGLDPILQRAVARISNHQLVGIGTPAAGIAGKAVTGSSAAGAVAGVMKAVIDNPSVKSRLAIMLNGASKGAVTLPQAMIRVGAYSDALGRAVDAGNAQPAADQDNQ